VVVSPGADPPGPVTYERGSTIVVAHSAGKDPSWWHSAGTWLKLARTGVEADVSRARSLARLRETLNAAFGSGSGTVRGMECFASWRTRV